MMNNEDDIEISENTKVVLSIYDEATQVASDKSDDIINLEVGKQTTQESIPCSSWMGMGEPSSSGLATPLRQALHAAAALATVTDDIACPAPSPEVVVESQNSLARSESRMSVRAVYTGGISNQIQTTQLNTNTSKPLSATAVLPATITHHHQPTAGAVNGTFPLNIPVLAMPYHNASNPGIPMHLPALGAPGSVPPGSFHQLAAAIKASEVPPVFRDKPQRSGKWTREEEVYAELLIELFEKGHINEKNGCTLRSFLSRKLHCAPMRISKKYAGKGIGKMVFLSKCNFRGMGDGIGSPAYLANMQRLRQAESTFYKSCIPELNVQMVIPLATGISQPYGGLGPSVHMMHSGLPPIAPSPGVAPPFEPSKMILAAQQPPGSSSVWLTINHGTSNVVTAPSVPLVQAQAPTATYSGTQAPSATTKPQLSAHQSLEQAYFSVAKIVGHDMSQPKVEVFNNKLLFPDVNNCRDRELGHEPQRKHDVTGTMKRSQSTPLPTVNHTTSAQYTRDNSGNSQALQNQSTQFQTVAYSDDLPDFLAGFDKISEQNNPTSPIKLTPTFDPAQFSPTYTSRSFDDLHRLLGKNLSPEVRQQSVQTIQSPHIKDLLVPLPSACNKTGQTSLLPSQSTGAQKSDGIASSFPVVLPKAIPHRQLQQNSGHATMDTFGADSYSVFAQQSAFAASQHSAYISAPSSSDDGIMMLLGDDFEINYPSFNEVSQDHCAVVAHSEPYTAGYQVSSHFTTMVSEPSDHGSDETHGDSFTSGTDNPTDGVSSSNESDGSYSESSRRKKARSSHHVYDDMELSFQQRSRH